MLHVNGQRLYAASAGPEDGPLVLLLHGFPEMSYGWRHQLGALAAAGLHVVAPDQRGYGWSTKPQGWQAYSLDRLADDIVALAGAFGHKRARVVGHDWGGLVTWALWWSARRRLSSAQSFSTHRIPRQSWRKFCPTRYKQ